MKLKFFIDRPIFSFVISIIIVVLGIIGFNSLPIEQYPDIAPPTIQVPASYTGANAETVRKSVITPLEEAINGVENMTYMTSTATNTGDATITIYFKQGSDGNMAAINVQNRISKATSQLPSEVTKIGVTTEKRQSSMLKVIGLYSPDKSYDETFLTNYFNIHLKPSIMRITGVGGLSVMGSEYAMRIWLDPGKMAEFGLEPSDIETALNSQNIEASAGALGSDSRNTFQYTLKYRGRLETPEEFGNIVIRADADGRVLRLKDVAEIDLGAQSYTTVTTIDGAPAVTAMVFQTAGSNAREIDSQIDSLLKEESANFPKGVESIGMMSTTKFLNASIGQVIETLLEAFLLVILVVFFFLQNYRATLIPAVSIIVSLIGTFAFMTLIGFSINLLTLFGLVLAIGTVVDDAIIVVEAVQTKFDSGYKSPYKASVDAMTGITSAIITSTLVFMAVFIPVSFMSGTSGIFYKEFGLTMAVAVGISAINALSLSPALCALFLKPNEEITEGKRLSFCTKFRMAFNAAFEKVQGKYAKVIGFFIHRKWVSVILFIGAICALFYMMNTTKTGLIPEEATGSLFVNMDAPAGYTLDQTDKIMNRAEEVLKQMPQVAHYNKISGSSLMSGTGASHGMFIVQLKDWSERKGMENSQNAVSMQIFMKLQQIKKGNFFVFGVPMIAGYGSGNNFQIFLEDRSGKGLADLDKVSTDYVTRLLQRKEVAMAMSSFNINYPQYQVDIDAATCEKMGVSPNQVLSALSTYYGGNYVSSFNRFTKIFRVIMQAPDEFRKDEQSLNNVKVKTSDGMAPISRFVKLTKVYGAESLDK